MVTPDPKIDPNRNQVVRNTDGEQRRKQPVRDYKEVAHQVDERRFQVDDDELKSKDKKKLAPARSDTPSTIKEEKEVPLNLFDLARGPNQPISEDEGKQSRPNLQKEEDDDSSLLVDRLKEKRPKTKYVAENLPRDRPFEHIADKNEQKEDSSSFGLIEQPDLAQVNPLSPSPLASFTSAISTTQTNAPLPTRSVQEIIDQIVKEVYTLEQSGKTETVITLKGSFNGAHLIVTQYDSAHKEMNITIDNLTAQGQELLNMNKQGLIDELAKKDMVVHIFTATTTVESPQVATSQDGRDRNRQGFANQQEQPDQRQKRQNRNET